jgi:hypothetical protein
VAIGKPACGVIWQVVYGLAGRQLICLEVGDLSFSTAQIPQDDANLLVDIVGEFDAAKEHNLLSGRWGVPGGWSG